jgi:hypothetical protein
MDLERLETRAMTVVLIHILGIHSLHKVFGGQMLLIERVLVGTYFGWAQMMLMTLKFPLASHQQVSRGNYTFGIFLCSFFFERIPTLCPHVCIRDGGPQDPRM